MPRRQEPGLTSIPASDGSYWAEQYRRAKYDFDAQSVRPYFPYMQVQEGILTTAAHLFHVEFKAVPDAKTWDASVSTYDVFDAASTRSREAGPDLPRHAPARGQGQVVLLGADRSGNQGQAAS